MKRIFWTLTILALFGTLAASIVHAQSSDNSQVKKIELGPAFEIGADVWNGNVSSSLKTSAELSFDAGLLGYYNINNGFGLSLGVVYDSRVVNFHDYQNASNYSNVTTGYLMFQPGLTISAFTIGLGIGLPMSVNMNSGGTSSNFSETLSTNQASTIIEIRLGASVPLVSNESGDLRFLIDGSYPLGNTFNNLKFGNGSPYSSDGPTPTLRAGFTYQFCLSH